MLHTLTITSLTNLLLLTHSYIQGFQMKCRSPPGKDLGLRSKNKASQMTTTEDRENQAMVNNLYSVMGINERQVQHSLGL